MPEVMSEIAEIEVIANLDKDLRSVTKLLGRREARYLVNHYYIHQDNRKRSDSQIRELSKRGEPKRVITWESDNQRRCEENLKKLLKVFADEYKVGRWMQSICGVAEVISAGLLAQLDIRKAKTFGHFWSFAGLNPTVKWKKGEKRPWNADLKTLVVFKAGECFIKVQNNEKDFYGKLFREKRDALEVLNNEGKLAEAAAECLRTKDFTRDTNAKKCYEAGKFPDGHLHSRARRFVAKLFLAHVHHAMYEDYHGEPAPDPWVFVKGEGDHRHIIKPPNWPCDLGGKSLRELVD